MPSTSSSTPRLQVFDLRHLVDSAGDHSGYRRPEPHDSVPVHMIDTMSKIRTVTRRLCPGVWPRAEPEEIAERAGLSVDDARCVHKMTRQPLSLDQPVGDHEDNYFGEFLEENRDDDPLYDTN